jgi:hypothetical protein
MNIVRLARLPGWKSLIALLRIARFKFGRAGEFDCRMRLFGQRRRYTRFCSFHAIRRIFLRTNQAFAFHTRFRTHFIISSSTNKTLTTDRYLILG